MQQGKCLCGDIPQGVRNKEHQLRIDLHEHAVPRT